MNCKLIEDFLNGTYITERTIERSTLEFYLSKARSFGRFLGRDARLDDLQSGSVNAFLTARLKHQCKSTVHGARSALVAIWNYAVEAGELERSPERIKPIKRDDTIVEGWDTQQQLTLLGVVQRIEGEFKGDGKEGVLRRDYWRAVILTLYDTGWRVGDLFDVESHRLRSGSIAIIQHKTRKIIESPITDVTWTAIQRIRPTSREKPFRLICRRWFFIKFAEICEEAGVPGRTRKIRITSGSEYERLYPGEGHLHLGNTRQVFDKHYNWRRITRRPSRPLPPFGDAG